MTDKVARVVSFVITFSEGRSVSHCWGGDGGVFEGSTRSNLGALSVLLLLKTVVGAGGGDCCCSFAIGFFFPFFPIFDDVDGILKL